MAEVQSERMDSQATMAKYVPVVAPVVLVAVGYMDPGNWACAIEGGSRFGFELLWVVVVSNLMAALFQTLATRLGLVTGKHLAQICREDYPSPVCLLLWILSEVSIVALDLTMVLGTAVGLNLLLGIPILPSVLVLALDGILFPVILPFVGVQRVELIAGSIVGAVLVCFGLGTLLSQPSATAIAGGMWPKVRGDSLYTAVGLLGANVVPHTFYLHSALLQRQQNVRVQSIDIVCQENLWDTARAFGIAMIANIAVLVVAATTFHNVGLVILNLQDANTLLEQILSNSIAPAVFGLALLCAGQLSALTGTLTGKVTMEGFLDMTMQPWLHRSLVRGTAMIPAVFCAWHYGSEGLYQLLVFSQIIIALELPFSAVPLIKASASEARMGAYRISSLVESVAWISVALVVGANIWLVFDLLLEEIDEFAGFAAHLENLLGTDSFGHYGEETLNTSVFALVLVGIGLSVGFLVWLIVTPLRLDRIAMERKWVEEYELFERNEETMLETLDIPRLPGVEFMPRADAAIPDRTQGNAEIPRLGVMDFPPRVDVNNAEAEVVLEPVEPESWEVQAVSSSSCDVEDSSAKEFEIVKTSDPIEVCELITAAEVLKPIEVQESLDSKVVPEEIRNTGVLLPPSDYGDSEVETKVQVSKPSEELNDVVAVVDDSTVPVEDSNATVNKYEVLSNVEDNKIVVTEPSCEDIVPHSKLAITIVREKPVTVDDSSLAISEEAARPPDATIPATVKLMLIPDGPKLQQQVLLTADDLESIALKKAEAEADADLLDKDEDEGDDLEHEDVVVGTLSTGGLGGSYSNLAYEGTGSARSLGGRSDTSDAGGSGSGSLSRLSGLGRAARRQFAAYLDEFWGKLFDLHGQPVVAKGGTGSGRSAAGLAYDGGNASRSGDNSAYTGRQDYLEREGSGGYATNLGMSKSTSSLRHQVDQMDAYVRAHSHATASTSSGFPGLTQDYSGRSGELQYLGERQYSSMHLPSYSEDFERQPATIHGYQSPSFLGGRSATSSPAVKSSRNMLDIHAVGTSRTLSGQSLSGQSLSGLGVDRELEGSHGFGRSLHLDRHASLESTIQSLRSSHLSMNAMARSSMNGGDLHMPEAGSRSWDPLVFRATGELHTPSSLGHSPIGRLGMAPGERAPLSFDQISPSQSRRDGFSIQSAQTENSLWSRQPFEQLFGGGTEIGSLRTRAGSSGSGRNGSIGRSTSKVEGIPNSPTNLGSGVDSEREIMENLRACLCKLLCLDGSEWLFRVDNGSDEDLVAAVAGVEKMHLEADPPDRLSRSERWQVHGRPVASLLKSSNELRRVCYCGEACVWGRGLLISFGVWCVHRVLELSLMESRPELWGKYTYVLNRLQGILEPAFSKPRTVAAMCSCVLDAGSGDILSKRGRPLIKQGSLRDYLNGDSQQNHSSSPQTYPYPWPWGRNSSSSKGRGASAAVFLEMIKEVEQAVGSRKGRTGTAAGDVAFPKGKENLASVLKRYKRRLGSKPPGSAVAATTAGNAGGGGGGAGGGRRSNGYAQALVFAASLSMVLLPSTC